MSGIAGPNREPSLRLQVSVWPVEPGRVVYGVIPVGGAAAETTTDAEIARVLRAAAAQLAEDVRPASSWTCVLARCADESHPYRVWDDAVEEMREHVATRPHPAYWPVTFRLDYPGSPTPGVFYLEAVLIEGKQG